MPQTRRNRNKSTRMLVRYVEPDNLIPPRTIVRMESKACGYSAAGVNYANNTAWFSCYANSMFEPWFTSKPFNDTTTGGWALTQTAGTSYLMTVPGAGNFSRLYNFYRGLRARLTVKCVPASFSDVPTVVIATAPALNAQTATVSLNSSQAFQNSINKSFSAATGEMVMRTQWFNVWDIMGLSKNEYMDLQATAVSSNPANNIGAQFMVNLFLSSPAVITSNIGWEFILEMDVEFSQPEYNNLTG